MKTHLPRRIIVALVIYSLATTMHFFHNGIFLDQYPNMPEWLSSGKVFASLLGVHVVGLLGLALLCVGVVVPGYMVLALYAALGFDGLAHYALAGISSHTLGMNLTILFEFSTALVLFALVGVQLSVRDT